VLFYFLDIFDLIIYTRGNTGSHMNLIQFTKFVINIMHTIEIYRTMKQLKMIKKLLKKYKEQITSRNIKIKYIIHDKFIGKLHVNDDKLKIIDNPSELFYFFKCIDNMSTREKLLEKCALPNYNKTSHCFSDSIHHTCCILGLESRKYADSFGNPI
jgi:hypothetical protein